MKKLPSDYANAMADALEPIAIDFEKNGLFPIESVRPGMMVKVNFPVNYEQARKMHDALLEYREWQRRHSGTVHIPEMMPGDE